MAKPTADRDGATVAQLKDDINSGRTGDKAPGFDPAAAPLGVDEEAAGTPLPAEVVAQARRDEQRSTHKHPNEVDPRVAPDARFPRGPFIAPALLGAVAALLVLGIIALALRF